MAPSKLMELPPELRNQIWEYSVQGSANGVHFWTSEPAITQVCRQTRAETRLMYYAMNTFVVGLYPGISTMNQNFDRLHQCRLLKWLSCIGYEARSNIKYLCFLIDMRMLSVSAAHYASLFELLGWNPNFSGLRTTAIWANTTDPNQNGTFTIDARKSMRIGRKAIDSTALRILANAFTPEALLTDPKLQNFWMPALRYGPVATLPKSVVLVFYLYCYHGTDLSLPVGQQMSTSEAISCVLEMVCVAVIWLIVHAFMVVVKVMCYAVPWILIVTVSIILHVIDKLISLVPTRRGIVEAIVRVVQGICVAGYLLYWLARVAGPKLLFALGIMVVAILLWVVQKHL